MSTTTSDGCVPGRVQGQVWTIDAVRELGVTTDVETAAAMLGIGRTKAYELAKTNEFPCAFYVSAVDTWFRCMRSSSCLPSSSHLRASPTERCNRSVPRVGGSTVQGAKYPKVVALFSSSPIVVADGSAVGVEIQP